MEYTTIILSIVLIIVSGYFHALETALVSINDKRIKMLADSGDRKAQRMNRFLQDIPFKVSALKTGQLLSSFSAIALVELTFFHRFFIFWNERYSIFLSAFLSFVIILLIVTFIMLIGGKFVPQRIGFKKNEELINSSMEGINRISVFLTPMVKLSTFISNMISKAFGVNPYELNSEITEEEIRLMVDAGEERGTIDEDEKEMINNIFEFDTKTAEDIATHRTDITAISVNADFEDIKAIINEEKYSRIPVYEENIDNIVGIIHIKDLARYVINNNTDVNGENFDLRKIMMEPYFVPFSKKTDELFEEMQKMKNHLAVVIDEYGGTVGIVTMEDLLEEIVGNILDEYDSEENPIEIKGNDTYLIKGTTDLDEVEEILGIPLASDDYDTLSGLLISKLGHIPADGENISIEIDGYIFKSEKTEEKRIETVRVYKKY